MAGMQAVPGPVVFPLRKLSQLEYHSALGDALGTSVRPEVGSDTFGFGYDNIGQQAWSSAYGVAQLLKGAKAVAADVFAHAELKARVVTCTTPDDAGCVRSVITTTGLRLFRRPVLDEELPVYEKVYAAARLRGDAHEAALEQMLVALLMSAPFLHRIELASGAQSDERVPAYDLASRLSFLLWSSGPDDVLLEKAAQDSLSEDAQLEAELARLWADERSQRFARSFGGQWLPGRLVLSHRTDEIAFPDWTASVAAAAAQEVADFFDLMVREDQDMRALVQGRPHPVPGALASLYGLTPPADPTSSVLLDSAERTGVLGSVAFLAGRSYGSRTSAIQRALFITERLLCSELRHPPSEVDFEFAGENIRNSRQLYDAIRAEKPSCVGCHVMLDPLGLTLEHYDPVGRYRETYEDGSPIDVNVQVQGLPQYPASLELSGAFSLANVIASDPRFLSCAARQLYIFGLGRFPEDVDRANAESVAQAWQSRPTLTIKELVRAFVLSDAFRVRQVGGEP